MIAKGINVSVTVVMRRGRSEKGYATFVAKKEGVIGVRDMVRGMMSWETMEGAAGE